MVFLSRRQPTTERFIIMKRLNQVATTDDMQGASGYRGPVATKADMESAYGHIEPVIGVICERGEDLFGDPIMKSALLQEFLFKDNSNGSNFVVGKGMKMTAASDFSCEADKTGILPGGELYIKGNAFFWGSVICNGNDRGEISELVVEKDCWILKQLFATCNLRISVGGSLHVLESIVCGEDFRLTIGGDLKVNNSLVVLPPSGGKSATPCIKVGKDLHVGEAVVSSGKRYFSVGGYYYGDPFKLL